MNSVSIQDFDLTQLDMAYAVSQANLNSGLYTYLSNLSIPEFGWGFDIQGKQFVPPKDPAHPQYTFTGSLSAPGDGTTPVLDMSGSGAANQVAFNVTFSSATFTNAITGTTYVQQDAQWVLPFGATLQQAALSEAPAPQWLQKKLDGLTEVYGDVFDLYQVLIDLSGLNVGANASKIVPNEFGVVGMGDWFVMLAAMAEYIAANAQTLFPSLPSVGYAVVHDGTPPAAPLPTFTPSAAQFVIVPDANPNRSALVWAVMTDGAPMPTTPSEEFTSVTFFTDDDTPGLAVLRSGNFQSFLLRELGRVNDAFGAAQYVKAVEVDGNGTWQAQTLSSPGGITLILPSADNKGQLASWTMPTQRSDAEVRFLGAPTDFYFATSDSHLTVQFAQYNVTGFYNQVTITGKIVFSVSFASGGADSTASWTSPNFEYEWIAAFSIEPDNGANGGVHFVYDSDASSFPTDPTIVGSSSASGTVPPDTQDLLTHLLKDPIDQMKGNLQADVLASLGGLSDFVFPGGDTFLFQGAAVGTPFSLYMTIQYQNPTG